MIKYGITFSLLKRSKNNPELLPVRLRVSFNGQRPDFYTGVSVSEIDWNGNSQRSYNKRSLENRELDKLETIIEDIFTEFEYENKRFPTVKELRSAFKVATNKKPAPSNVGITVLDLFDIYTENIGTLRQWADGRYKKYNQLKNHWELYGKEIILNELKEEDLIGFIKYFQNGPLDFKTRKKKKPHRNTSIAKEFADFMSMISWASSKDLYSGKLQESFEPIFKGSEGGLKDLVFLTWEELMKLYSYDFENDYKDKLRDLFCFLCFTGLRFSDLKTLKRDHVKNDHILVVTEKTIDPLKIELNDFSKEILDKYKDIEFPKNLALPVISQQNFNDDIKIIAALLEFDERINEVYFIGSKRHEKSYYKHEIISSHAGRRTFVTNGISMGIPTDVIMKWTGHKDQRAMRPYIKIIDDLKKSEMSKFNKK